jgi:Heterokaryon incompatibility protein (HET)
MSPTIPPDCYQDLLPRSESIRLLRLLPSEDEHAVIQCQLFNSSLHGSGKRAHPYEALSYVWGKSDETLPIRIGEHDLPTTPNLHEALTSLRHRYIERVIWVDALCINQADVTEKEQQILLMAKIYGQANRVVVWLGEAEDNSDQALEEIRVAGGEMPSNSLNKEAIEKAVLALLRRPWFRRIWVREQVGNICSNN